MTTSQPRSKNPTHSHQKPAVEALDALQRNQLNGETVFTKVQQGTKEGIKGFLEPENLLTAEGAQERIRDGGNYGFRLGYETSDGWMFAVIDVEERDVLPDAVAEWTNDRALVRWESLHVGLNRLLMVTPAAYDLLSEVSDVDLDGDGDHELEVLAPSRGHALGPGSTVEHRHCSDRKPCDRSGKGDYCLVDVNPHAPLVGVDAVEDLLQMLGLSPDNKSVERSDRPTTSTSPTEPSETGDEAKWSSLDANIRRRIDRAESFDKWGNEFKALKEGRYADAGFPNDRSEAEYRLVEILGWLFDDDKTKVRRVMTAICRLNPQTSAGIRKWIERDVSEDNYRDNTLNACQHESTYNPPSARPYKNRPDVSADTKSGVFEAILDYGIASSQMIADHEAVNRSQRQVQRALNEYGDDIQSKKVDRKRVYYVDTAFISAEKRDEYNL